MSTIIRVLITALCIATSALTAASALTLDEIEVTWSKLGRLSGTFVEQHSDGSTQTGTFVVYDPTLVHMTYTNGPTMTINGGASRKIGNVVAGAGKVTVVDDFNGEIITHQLGPFRQVFSKNPDLSDVQTGGGENASTLVVRMRDPRAPNQGYVDVFYDKNTALMVRWKSNVDGNQTQTDFHY